MFDSSPPPNLPVEPHAAPPSPPAPVSSTPSSVPPTGAPSGKTEPEDIFVGLDEVTKQGAAYLEEEHAVPARRSMLPFLIIGGVVFLLVIAGAVWWFFLRASSSSVPSAAPTVRTSVPAVTEQVEQPPTIPVEQPTRMPSTQTNVAAPDAIPRPDAVTPAVTSSDAVSASSTVAAAPMSEGQDTDGDRLTDIEERLYGSNASQSDTDGDTYVDGDEVRSLFSPVSKGKKIADEPFMTTRMWNGWKLLLPVSWSVGEVLDRPGSAVIATGSTARFLLDREANPSRLPLAEWLSRNQISGEMRAMTTKAGMEVIQMNDDRTTFFAQGDTVLALTYDGATDKAFEYRATYALMVNTLLPNP